MDLEDNGVNPADTAVETPVTPAASTPAAAASETEPEVVLDLGVSKPATPKDLSDDELAKLPENDARKWGKEWKTTAGTYREAHEVAQSFGGVNNIKALKGVHDTFIAPSLDPQAFFGELAKIDSQRAAQLMTFAGSKSAGSSKEELLTELFGAVPTKKDIELFRQFKAADGKLVSIPGGEPVPERFLYAEAQDEDGNTVKTLRTQKEIDANPDYQTWKELQRQRQEFNERTARETEKTTREEQTRLATERETKINESIEEWFKPVDTALEQLGFTPDPSDTPQDVAQKRLIRRIFEGAVREEFDQVEENARLFQTSLAYIRNGRPDLLGTIDAHNRIKGIVADTVTQAWNLLKGGVRARARATQAAVTNKPAPNPVVSGASNGLPSTKIVAPADITTNPASTAEFMNKVYQESLARRGIQQTG